MNDFVQISVASQQQNVFPQHGTSEHQEKEPQLNVSLWLAQ